jgi:CRP/FNR family cyclic AMP-dependent transcriptional regulator
MGHSRTDHEREKDDVSSTTDSTETAGDSVLVRAGLFQGVAEEAREALTSALQYSDYARGETVFTEGEQGDTLYIVLSGKVKVGRRAADGRENMLSVMGPSDMFGELSLFDPGPRTATATVLTEARLASLAHSSLRPWISDRPEIAEQLLEE